MKYLGIDLGTTYTKAAVYDTVSKKTELVELNQSNHDFGFGRTKYAMPTAVAVSALNSNSRQFEVGIKAINMKLYPDTLFFDNFKTQLDLKQEFANNNPNISFVELISAIFRHVYNSAKLQFLANFDRIILTVPASTVKNGYRWERMLNAANIVFVKNPPIDIILEPEAAGYALLDESLKSSSLNGKSFLIYDFGGGTFDTSVFQVVDEQIYVVGESVGSDEQRRWGGIYVDDILRSDYRRNGSMIKSLVSNIRNSDFRQQKQIEELLREEPIKAKILMHAQKEYAYSLQDYTLTFEHFNELIYPMIEDTIACAQELVDTREDDGQKLSLADISDLFLVGGSSRIKLIQAIWQEKKSQCKFKYNLRFADLEIVAIGAAKYNALKVEAKRLLELAQIRIYNKDYSRAALYLSNADSPESKYLLALLYFEGLIGTKRDFVKAVKYLKESDTQLANVLLARCAFQGRQGVPRNHTLSKEYINKAEGHCICKYLRQAIENQTVSSSVLDEIYNYNPLEEYLDNLNISELEKKQEQSTTDGATNIVREVEPCCPELDVISLLNKANNLQF